MDNIMDVLVALLLGFGIIKKFFSKKKKNMMASKTSDDKPNQVFLDVQEMKQPGNTIKKNVTTILEDKNNQQNKGMKKVEKEMDTEITSKEFCNQARKYSKHVKDEEEELTAYIVNEREKFQQSIDMPGIENKIKKRSPIYYDDIRKEKILIDKKRVRNGIIMAEILGKPKALRNNKNL